MKRGAVLAVADEQCQSQTGTSHPLCGTNALLRGRATDDLHNEESRPRSVRIGAESRDVRRATPTLAVLNAEWLPGEERERGTLVPLADCPPVSVEVDPEGVYKSVFDITRTAILGMERTGVR